MQRNRRENRRMKNAFRDLKAGRERDERFFERYFLSSYDMECGYEQSALNILACKFLYLYLVKMFKERGITISSHILAKELPLMGLDDNDLDSAIYGYLAQCFPLADAVLGLMSHFGWKYEEYAGYVIDQGFYDAEDFKKPVWEFLSPYFESIKDDIKESSGGLDLGILTSRRYGLFLQFIEKYPKELPDWLVQEIDTISRHVTNPMAYYLTDYSDNTVIPDGTFVSCFAFGFCGGWECYCEKYVIHPVAALYAYYMEQYIKLGCKYCKHLRNYMRRHAD